MGFLPKSPKRHSSRGELGNLLNVFRLVIIKFDFLLRVGVLGCRIAAVVKALPGAVVYGRLAMGHARMQQRDPIRGVIPDTNALENPPHQTVRTGLAMGRARMRQPMSPDIE